MFLLTLVSVLAVTTAEPETLVVPLPGIVVTPTRGPEEVGKVPAAVSVVPKTRYASARQISLADALQGVPGTFVQSRSGASDVRITIRGFGARGNGERSNTGNMRGIRVLTDGISITEPDGRTSLDYADLTGIDKIEVTRSNVSMLYGNASGGVVNMQTNLNFENPYGEASGRAGSFGFHREQGAGGFAVGQGRGVLTLTNTTFDGWRDHSSSSATQTRLRFKTPIDEKSRLGVLLDGAWSMNRYPGALTQAELDSAPEQANPTFVARDERRYNRLGRAALTFDRTMGETGTMAANVFVEPKVLQRSERNRFRDFTRYHVGGSANGSFLLANSAEFQARTFVGADDAYQDGAILFYNLIVPGGTRSDVLFQNKREGANSFGVFLDEQLRWGERWSASAGVRYDNLYYISQDFINPPLSATKRFTAYTPKATLNFNAGTHTLYAALGGGIEAPAFNEIDPPPPYDTLTTFNPFLEPMQSTTYEVGARGGRSLASLGTLRYEIAGYFIKTKNEIVPFNGGAYFFTAGESQRTGLELGLDWAPNTTLSVGGSLTFMDPKYTDYVNDLGNFNDNQIPGLPKTTADGRVRYATPIGLLLEGRVQHVGAYFADDANTAKADAVTLFHGSVEWRNTFENMTLRVFATGENLTDENYVASVFINGIGGRYYEPGLPANVSAGVSLNFR